MTTPVQWQHMCNDNTCAITTPVQWQHLCNDNNCAMTVPVQWKHLYNDSTCTMTTQPTIPAHGQANEPNAKSVADKLFLNFDIFQTIYLESSKRLISWPIVKISTLCDLWGRHEKKASEEGKRRRHAKKAYDYYYYIIITLGHVLSFMFSSYTKYVYFTLQKSTLINIDFTNGCR